MKFRGASECCLSCPQCGGSPSGALTLVVPTGIFTPSSDSCAPTLYQGTFSLDEDDVAASACCSWTLDLDGSGCTFAGAYVGSQWNVQAIDDPATPGNFLFVAILVPGTSGYFGEWRSASLSSPLDCRSSTPVSLTFQRCVPAQTACGVSGSGSRCGTDGDFPYAITDPAPALSLHF